VVVMSKTHNQRGFVPSLTCFVSTALAPSWFVSKLISMACGVEGKGNAEDT